MLLLSVGITPLMNIGNVSALTISQRSLQLGSAVVSASTTYTYSFVPATAGAIQGLKFQACTTALGTCTAPAGLSFSSAAGGTVGGAWTTATNFSVDGVGAGSCTPAANVLCANRTQAVSETASGVRTVAFTTITNPNGTSCATSNCTFFVRINTFSDTAYATAIDNGVVASSTTQTLTVSATVQENLTFCIGSTAIDNATSAVPLCASVSGTSLNLGTLNSSAVSVSPVGTANNGDTNNGLAEVGTNASNGIAISYNAIQQSGANHQGTLRVAGANCAAGSTNTDQCVNAVGSTAAALVAGAESFGMTVAGINCSNVTSYTCNFSGGTYNMVRNANYDCDGTNTYPSSENNQIVGTTTCGYAWDETGSSQTIASSSTVVGNEALILKFASTPNITTPTGSYTAQANFVATATF